jgi:outer membrane protein OmpA-like peptidoglycan-associated protein
MKNLFFKGFILLSFLNFLPYNIAANKPLLAGNSINASKLFVDAKKNIYVTGSFSGVVRFSKTLIIGSYGNDDIFLAKYDPEGNCLWATNAGSDGTDEGRSVIVDDAGYIYITGFFEGRALFGEIFVKGDKQSLFVAKYNPSGDPLWIKPCIGKEGSLGYDIKVDKLGNTYIAGSFYQTVVIGNKTLTSTGGSDILLLKLSPKGDVIWGKTAGGLQDDNLVTPCLSSFNDNFYLTGYFSGKMAFEHLSAFSAGANDVFLTKFNSAGSPQWLNGVGGKGYDFTAGISADKEGNVYLTGNCDSSIVYGKNQISSKGESDVFMTKFNAGGEMLFLRSFGTAGNEKSTSCSVDGLGNIFVGGYFNFNSLSGQSLNTLETVGNDLFVLKFKGAVQDNWNIMTGEQGNDMVLDLFSDQENNTYILGCYEGSLNINKTGLSNSGGVGVFLAKVNPAGTYSVLKTIINGEPNSGDQNKFVNYYAKLLHGKEKASLVDQTVNLKDSKGEIIQTTKTDIYGDFSFKGVNVQENFNIVLEKNENLKSGEPTYLANQEGEIIKELNKDKNNDFAFDILSTELMKLVSNPEEENANKLKKFKTSKEQEILIVENILYEPGEFNVSAENALIIGKLSTILKQNPTYTIEVYSYTDAVGEASSNLVLSEKRAKAIADLFVKKGIKAERVKGIGFGETKILNRCVEGVDCSEIEHKVNRRTEFKFIKGKM